MTSWYFELDQYYDLPVSLHCDNRAAKALTNNANGHSKIKHVAMKSHWVHEFTFWCGVEVGMRGGRRRPRPAPADE